MRTVAELLGAWNGFYVMIGSAAAGLTGLMFVVISLVRPDGRAATQDGVSIFSSPTVLHFSCALFTAAIMTMPFRSFLPIAIILGIAGVAGMVHVARVARRSAQLRTYEPDVEDWIWHVSLPFVAYAALASGAIAISLVPLTGLYGPAVAVTLLLFIGIHNAWDVVTYIATGKADEKK